MLITAKHSSWRLAGKPANQEISWHAILFPTLINGGGLTETCLHRGANLTSALRCRHLGGNLVASTGHKGSLLA